MHSLDVFSIPWIVAFCVVLVAAFVRGVSGFGLALILAPILLLLMNSKSTVVVNLLLAIVSNLVVLPLGFRHIYLKGILPMVIFAIPGIAIGAWIITIIEPSTLKIVIGAVTVISAIPLAMGVSKAFRKEKLACGFSGFLGGLLAADFGFDITFTVAGALSLLSAFVVFLVPDLVLPPAKRMGAGRPELQNNEHLSMH